MITRFAPSPTGRLHLGHAYSACLTFDAARTEGGTCHLRIEDIDHTRCRPEFDDAIIDDLTWLGCQWPAPILRQCERLDQYARRLDDLNARGLLYRCFRTRKDMAAFQSAPHGPVPAFSGGRLPEGEEASLLASGAPFAWRLDLSTALATLGPTPLQVKEQTEHGIITHDVDPSRIGDIVLARKDIGTSYHMACVHDDIAQGITHVIRGEDLREAAEIHTLLYALFGATAPIYRHHALITDEAGNRLAKRDKARTLQSLREDGITPADIRSMVGLSQ